MAVKVSELNRLGAGTIRFHELYQHIYGDEYSNPFKIAFQPYNKSSAERTGMITVGEVKTNYGNSMSKDSVSVNLDQSSIGIRIKSDSVYMSPEQAIELAQLLMKAAECQSEYAAAAKDLEEQKTRLDVKYKDMISGLGLENPDLQEKDLMAVQRRAAQVDAKLQGPR